MSTIFTRRKTIPKNNKTRKHHLFEKLPKSSSSRIFGMETYKTNCAKNLILGVKSIKAAEETSLHKNDFVHVVLSKLKDYEKPVVVKIYDTQNIHLNIELKIQKKINNYRNTAKLICDFLCNDDKNKYITKIKNHIRFCNQGMSNLHFFVYEYIANGDISDFLIKNSTNIYAIKSIILQTVCVVIQLATMYGIYHGDINTGNILIDKTNFEMVNYQIEDETFFIKSYGFMPKMIDYGRSNFYQNQQSIPISEVWFDVIMTLGVMHPYIENDNLKQIVFNIGNQIDMNFPSFKECYKYVHKSLSP